MINFLIYIVILASVAFLMILALRYGVKWAEQFDFYLTKKSNRSFRGFQWHFRLPLKIGLIPEYFFSLVLGMNNYFKRNWWPLKIAAFLAVLVFVGMLKDRTLVWHYFSFAFIFEGGVSSLISSGIFIWYLNIITLLYAFLFLMICFESVKMHALYAPVRILIYALMSFFLAFITIAVLSVVVFFTILYFAFKIISFFFRSPERKQSRNESSESAGSIFRKGFKEFTAEYYLWKKESRNETFHKTKPRRKPKIIRRVKKNNKHEGDAPSLHPD